MHFKRVLYYPSNHIFKKYLMLVQEYQINNYFQLEDITKYNKTTAIDFKTIQNTYDVLLMTYSIYVSLNHVSVLFIIFKRS